MTKAKKFNLTELLNQRPLEQPGEGRDAGEPGGQKEEIVMVDVYDLEPSKENFYQVDDSLKRSVELVGILQPLLVKRPENGKYQVIAGHRRRLAVLALMEEGKESRRYVPCVLKKEDVRDRLAIILANRFRDKSDWEKMMEVVEAESLAKELKEDYGLGGRTRGVLAEMMGMSQAQVGRYQAIYHHLDKSLMEEFQAGRVEFSGVSELCGLPREWQQAAASQIKGKGSISLTEIRELKQKAMTQQEPREPKGKASRTGREEIEPGEVGKKTEEKKTKGGRAGAQGMGKQEPGKEEPRQEPGEGLQSPEKPCQKENDKWERPMTRGELFGKVCKRLEGKGKMPDILDYASGDSSADPIRTDEFSLKNNLDYGGNEGISLDFWVELWTEGKWEKKGLGTFKTLRSDGEAMHVMAALLADFMIEGYGYVRENPDGFCWEGADAFPVDETGKRADWKYCCSSVEKALKRKEELLEEYPCVVVRDNASREETVYYRNQAEQQKRRWETPLE